MSESDKVSSRHTVPSTRRRRLLCGILTAVCLAPYVLLLNMSSGSGWTFPGLIPDRMNFQPWKNVFADRDGMLHALLVSASISSVVAVCGTLGGLLIGRAVRRSRRTLWRLFVYLPFVTSPVVAAACLYDLFVRVQLAGTMAGVILAQTVFAMSLAAVYFSELWSDRTDRMESLVRSLGGTDLTVWRHVILPQCSGLIVVCLFQTALYSWLDYGLVSVIGGGSVQSLTSKLFGYIREASVNQAAQSAIMLLAPALAGALFAGTFRPFARIPMDSK